MKKYMAIVLGCSLFFACGFGGPAPAASSGGTSSGGSSGISSGVYLIDDYEDGDFSAAPEWWRFDNATVAAADNSLYQTGDAAVAAAVGKYSMNISGTSTDWYVGGMGTYLAKKNNDLGNYNAVQMDIFGNGPGSGTIKIELVDDDKGNWQVEQDSKGVPVDDDKFAYNLTVDWRGWKRVAIPFSDFVIDNPGHGDGVLDVAQKDGKGGLLQMQLIFISPKKAGAVNYNIDNISLIRQ